MLPVYSAACLAIASHYLSASLAALALSITTCSPHPFDADAEGAKLLRLDAEWADLATERM
ncbi:MAG: hypothetical protein ACRD4I_16675 [Candidatus Angelobacter sp.]